LAGGPFFWSRLGEPWIPGPTSTLALRPKLDGLLELGPEALLEALEIDQRLRFRSPSLTRPALLDLEGRLEDDIGSSG
jgi:hypothetical protein